MGAAIFALFFIPLIFGIFIIWEIWENIVYKRKHLK